MFKLIHADLYKVFHRVYFYVLTLVVSALSFIVILSAHSNSTPQGDMVASILQFAVQYLSLPVMILPCLTDIVLNEEYREHTVKNTMAYGTNRVQLYSAKLITAFLLGVIMLIVVMIVFVGGALLLLPHEGLTTAIMGDFLARLGVAVVVYAACLSMAAFFSTLCSRNTLWMFLFYGVFFFTDLLLHLFKLDEGIKYVLKTQFNHISANPVSQLGMPIVVSLVTSAVFYAAGSALFCKKDVS